MLIIDETGDRKAGTKTTQVARQCLGSVGEVAKGIVAVSTVWADAFIYYPVPMRPSTPASRLPRGKRDPAFRAKPRLALEAGDPFRAVIADCRYGANLEFEAALGTGRRTTPPVDAARLWRGASTTATGKRGGRRS